MLVVGVERGYVRGTRGTEKDGKRPIRVKREMGRKKVIYRTVGCVRKGEKISLGRREEGGEGK